MTKTDRPRVEAPRHASGTLLGHYDAEVISVLPGFAQTKSDWPYLVRFEDGHEAGVLRRELRANAAAWAALDAMDREAGRGHR